VPVLRVPDEEPDDKRKLTKIPRTATCEGFFHASSLEYFLSMRDSKIKILWNISHRIQRKKSAMQANFSA
jgi:hypothetical protein